MPHLITNINAAAAISRLQSMIYHGTIMPRRTFCYVRALYCSIEILAWICEHTVLEIASNAAPLQNRQHARDGDRLSSYPVPVFQEILASQIHSTDTPTTTFCSDNLRHRHHDRQLATKPYVVLDRLILSYEILDLYQFLYICVRGLRLLLFRCMRLICC